MRVSYVYAALAFLVSGFGTWRGRRHTEPYRSLYGKHARRS